MNISTRSLVLMSLAVVLSAVGVTTAFALPEGDDDASYNVTGTRYTSLTEGSQLNGSLNGAQPVTGVTGDGGSVTAVLMDRPQATAARAERGTVTNHPRSDRHYLRLTRLDASGAAAGFEVKDAEVPGSALQFGYQEALDLRVLPDNSFVVVLRAGINGDANQGVFIVLRFNAQGEAVGRNDIWGYLCSGGDRQILRAARVKPVGSSYEVYALVECGNSTLVYRYPGIDSPSSVRSPAATKLVAENTVGADLEIGANGDVYALTHTYNPGGGGLRNSRVHRFAAGTLDRVGEPSVEIRGLPIDLAMDSRNRPLVWADTPDEGGDPVDTTTDVGGTEGRWSIHRLEASLEQPDTSWDDDGRTTVIDPRLGEVTSNAGSAKPYSLTVRPGDKVIATGPMERSNRSGAILAGLTNSGQTDTAFGQDGFKAITFTQPGGNRGGSASPEFQRVGEPVLQPDGKLLVPHTSIAQQTSRVAGPPSEGEFLGVTRLLGSPSQAGGGSSASNGSTTAGGLRPAAATTVCGRRAISLVRADVRGSKVKLSGLVGSALYGKTVTIQTDPKGAKASKFTRTASVKASRTGSFSVSVPRPARGTYASVRYRAVSGRAKSAALKLPQSLTSRSVKSTAGKITVKGRVKKSLLGKANRVKLRRLVCGRYRTVGTAKPDANGNYTVTFNATNLRGAAFYRAESKVLRKPGSKKYVTQYARAIAIRTTSQTG